MERTDLPMVMKVRDVARIMGISKATAYKVMASDDFPLITTGAMKLVVREAFFEWLDKKAIK